MAQLQSEAYVIETYDVNDPKNVQYRTVTPLPQPQRIARPAKLSLDDIKELLVGAGNAIDAAKEKYQADVASLDEYYRERNSLKAEIISLLEQVDDKKKRLTALEATGTPRDQFAAAIVASETEVSGIAGSLLDTLSEQAAQRIFGIPFNELTDEGRHDASARYRKVLQRFRSGSYTRIGRRSKESTAEQIEARSEELLTDVSELLESEHFSK
jgi:hypothetical protein